MMSFLHQPQLELKLWSFRETLNPQGSLNLDGILTGSDPPGHQELRLASVTVKATSLYKGSLQKENRKSSLLE